MAQHLLLLVVQSLLLLMQLVAMLSVQQMQQAAHNSSSNKERAVAVRWMWTPALRLLSHLNPPTHPRKHLTHRKDHKREAGVPACC